MITNVIYVKRFFQGMILACGSPDALKELLSAVTGQPVLIVGDDLRYRFRHELGPVEVVQANCLLMLVLKLHKFGATAGRKLLGVELLAVSDYVDTIASNLLGSTTPFPAF